MFFSVRVIFEKNLYYYFNINIIHCVLLCARFFMKDLYVLFHVTSDNFINYATSLHALQLRELIL